MDAAHDSPLVLALKKSRRPADEQHPVRVWQRGLLLEPDRRVTIFVIGGGVTIVESVPKPERIEKPLWSYIALGYAFLFDGISLAIAYRKDAIPSAGRRPSELCRPGKLRRSGRSLDRGGRHLGELLGAVAYFLITETRHLLIGHPVEQEIVDAIENIAKDQTVMQVGTAYTMHMGPDEVLVTMNVRFPRDRSAGEVIDAVDRIEKNLRERFPKIKRIVLEPQPAEGDS